MRRELFQLHATIEDVHWWFVGRRHIMQRVVRQVLGVPGAGSPPPLVVDIGCGTGANVAALADRYACVGIDTSSEAIDIARRRFPSVCFVRGQAPDDLGTAARDASLFLLMDVLEHVDDDFALLSTILGASSPGTHLLVTVPADESLWSEHDVSFGHFRRYDRARLLRVWAELPVTVRLLSYYNARLFPLVKAIRTANRAVRRTSGLDGTDFSLPLRPVNRALTAVFAGESERLLAALDGQRPGYAAGVSLIALLRRERGEIVRRSKPADVPPDPHQPAPDRLASADLNVPIRPAVPATGG